MATVKDIYKFLKDTPFQKFDNKRNDKRFNKSRLFIIISLFYSLLNVPTRFYFRMIERCSGKKRLPANFPVEKLTKLSIHEALLGTTKTTYMNVLCKSNLGRAFFGIANLLTFSRPLVTGDPKHFLHYF